MAGAHTRISVASSGADAGPDDVELVARMRRGDREALGALYDRHAPLLLALALRRLGRTGLAEDLIHDVFIEAFRRVRSFDPERGAVRAWLVTILRSRAIDRHRARVRRSEVAADLAEDAPDPKPSPEAVAERPRVRGWVRDLQPIYRDALEMTYFDGLTLAECADRLDVPVGTIKARVSRAVAQLRARLDAEDGTP